MHRLLRKIVGRLRIQPLGVTMPGARLPQRVRAIIAAAPLARISRMHLASLIGACAVICAAFLAVMPTRAQSNASAGTELPNSAPEPRFEVASVKPTPAEDRERGTFLTYPGGRIEARGCTLTYLIMVAYGVQKFQISGADGWIDRDRFSISAEPPADSAAKKIKPSNPKLPPPHEEALMLQALIADRFELALEQTTQDASGFALVLKGPHPNVHEPKDGQEYPVVVMGPTGDAQRPWYLQGMNAPMTKFADRLADMLSVPVVDHTGLAGSYDFAVRYASSTDEKASGPLLKDAIQDIGFKLEPAKVQTLHLEIVRAARPSEN